MNPRHPSSPSSKAWKFRIRLATLVAFLVLGLGTAAIERWRQEAFDQVWGNINEQLSHFLTPISERTNRVFTVISKVDRLLKVEEDNKRLLRENTELSISNQRLSEELGRKKRLKDRKLSSSPDLTFLIADVAGLITSGQSAALIINQGRDKGVRPRDPVVALGGLVGIVQSVSSKTARVQAITDSVSAVGVMDRDSRARGVLMGRGRTEPIEFMPENQMQPINVGATLITSGFTNSVFPKGIVVGTIIDRKYNNHAMPYGTVKPAVSFESLEEVLVVIPTSRLAGREGGAPIPMGSLKIDMPGGTPLAQEPGRQTSGTLTSATQEQLYNIPTGLLDSSERLPDPDEDDNLDPQASAQTPTTSGTAAATATATPAALAPPPTAIVNPMLAPTPKTDKKDKRDKKITARERDEMLARTPTPTPTPTPASKGKKGKGKAADKSAEKATEKQAEKPTPKPEEQTSKSPASKTQEFKTEEFSQ